MSTQSVESIGTKKVIVQVVRALTYLVYFYLIAVEVILFLGFFLLLFGANPSADFAAWAYRSLDRVMEPFRGIFTPIELGTTNGDVQAVFETSVLFAMIVYGIVCLILSSFIGWLSRRLGYYEAAEADAEAQVAADMHAAAYAQALAAAQAAAVAQPMVPTSTTVTTYAPVPTADEPTAPQAPAPPPPPPPMV